MLGKTLFAKQLLEVITQARAGHRKIHQTQKIGLLGLPFSAGQPKPGVCKGPDALRSSGLVQKLQFFGKTVKDFGNLDTPADAALLQASDENGMRRQELVGLYCQKVSEAVAQIEGHGYTCVTLGGDHSTGIGTLHGHLVNNPDLCVVWVDAHADINTVATSTSGNAHGMPLSFLIAGLHRYNYVHPAFDWVQHRLNAKDVVYIGLRDVDPMERFILNKWGIRAYDMRDVDRYGILHVVEMALEDINPKRNRPVHVSFDIDALDSLVAPSTGTLVPGGLTLREGLYIAEEISKTGNLCGLDLVEVNPTLGTKEDVSKTVSAAHQIIAGFFGSRRGGNMPVESLEHQLQLPEQLEDLPLKQETKI